MRPGTLFDIITSSPLIRSWRYDAFARRKLARYYSCSGQSCDCSRQTAVFMADGKINHGGLADRLRGIASCYDAAHSSGRVFKIHFTSPMPLENYLVPATVDWTIPPSRLSFDPSFSKAFFSEQCGYSETERQFQLHRISRIMASPLAQVHIYTNADTLTPSRFAEVFHLLFRPSQQVADAVNKIKTLLKPGYISVSARFLDLLGDFSEPHPIRKPLADVQRSTLITNCLKKISELHSHYNSHIFVASDSPTFLSAVGALPYCHTVPGTTAHLDTTEALASEDAHLKTFVDFFAIAGASGSFLLKGPGMYPSNFPVRAAETAGREVRILEF